MYQIQVQSLDKSQKLGILYKGTEIKQKTSTIGVIPVKICFHFKACTRNKNEKGKWTQQETGLERVENNNNNQTLIKIKVARGKDREVVRIIEERWE